MKNMNLISAKPDFSSWPISTSLKILLFNETKWPEYFSIQPAALAMILYEFAQQIKPVNFFNTPLETNVFFEFLRKLVESKPQNDNVLKEFSQITIDILDKLSIEERFDAKQEAVATHYLKLLALMLEPSYRYLFEKAEISIWTNDFQKISNTPYNSSAFLSHFRNTLLLSFQSRPFIKNYPALIRTICELAYSLDKANTDSNELQAMKLFDSLGVLDHTLKVTPIYSVRINRPTINRSIQAARTLIYEQFRPYVEENLLQFIVYKSYLAQAYSHATNLTALCDSKNYRAHCQSDYIRFKDNYRCPPDQLTYFAIAIRNNNHSKSDLDRVCRTMRSAESFIPWMEGFEFKRNYNTSHYFLHITDTKKNFLIDKMLFERDDPVEKSFTVLATYFQPEKPSHTDPLVGSTYTYTANPAVLIHEYIHHLYALFVKDLELDLTTTEGIAELPATGVCPTENMHNLRNFVNDTFIFEFLKARKYPFYFNALKWVAYLVNEQPGLFKTLMGYLQNSDIDNFYVAIDNFIDNGTHTQAFVAWSQQHVNICNNYLRVFPDGESPPKIYLADVIAALNLTQTTEDASFNYSSKWSRRNLLDFSDKAPSEIVLVFQPESKSERDTWVQQLIKGIPLPINSMLSGFSSSLLDDISLANKDNYPTLQMYINFGLKPCVFAMINAGLDSILFDRNVGVEEGYARLYTYFVMSYLSVMLGQPLAQKLAEKIHNKILCFFLQALTWTLLWNPGLFLSEDNTLLPTLCLQLIQGLGFKVGEEAYKLGKQAYFCASNFWYRKEPPALTNEDDILNSQSTLTAKFHG